MKGELLSTDQKRDPFTLCIKTAKSSSETHQWIITLKNTNVAVQDIKLVIGTLIYYLD